MPVLGLELLGCIPAVQDRHWRSNPLWSRRVQAQSFFGSRCPPPGAGGVVPSNHAARRATDQLL